MDNLEAILFDFDGVILESVDVKGWAFGRLFEQYPRHSDAIVAYHHANGGVPRFDKFRYIYKEILKEPLPDKLFEDLCRRYSELVFQKVIDSPFVPGAREFLEKYYQRCPLFVVSGTPEEEMRRVVEAKRLQGYFQGVYGSPQRKDYWTKHILENRGFDKDRVIFVGDAMSDYEAARAHGLKFIARVPQGQKSIFEKCFVDAQISDLVELERVILTL